MVRKGHVLVRRDGRFCLLDLSLPPEAYQQNKGLNRSFIARMLEESGSTDYACRDMLCTHGSVYLADVQPCLLLQAPLHSFFASPIGFASAHTEVARMAELRWFELHACRRLASGEFDLPCLPLRTKPSGAVPRKLEASRWRSIQDFGAPRRSLWQLPPLAGLGDMLRLYTSTPRMAPKTHTLPD